ITIALTFLVFLSCSLVTITGAARNLLVVKTPLQVLPSGVYIIHISGFPEPFIPQWHAAA
ncbi:unnamed protein product, partial [marine sediment metagenome]